MDKPVVTNAPLLVSALAGLSGVPKTLDSKWFYDTEGSRLFEAITALPEYYPTRTERAILGVYAARLAAHIPDGGALVELGSGASVKTRTLLDAARDLAVYVPIDIAAAFLEATAEALAQDYPLLPVRPVAGDFTAPFTLPTDLAGLRKCIFFPGSTIGNLDHGKAVALLTRMRNLSGVEAFILGTDLVKSPDVLVPAYDDAQGVTARFNVNILRRLNREVGADFDLTAFRHEARWHDRASRIEMHLVSLREQVVDLAGTEIRFWKGENIHTENSRKYTPESLSRIAEEAGWRIAEFLTDPGELFAVSVLVPRT